MAEFDASVIFGEDGTFTDEGRKALISGAGEGHAETKMFGDIKNLAGLAKVAADSNAAASRKLDNVIEIPGDDADDATKSAYHARLATAAGAPTEAAGYEFHKPEKMPEGMEYDQAAEDLARVFFFENKFSKAQVVALTKFNADGKIAQFAAMAEQATTDAAADADEKQKALTEGYDKLKTDWPGEKLPENNRIALAAINIFGDKDLKAKLKAADIYTNATNDTAWEEAGVPVKTRRLFHQVGLRTLDAKALAGARTSAADKSTMTDTEKARSRYPNTKW